MTDWSEPKDFTEWTKRIFSLRFLGLGLFIFCIAILELRFDWAERILGDYLVTTNLQRPESGSIWEASRQKLTARHTLEQIVTDRQALQREARGADSFGQIASGISPGQGAMISPEHFRRLYLGLPPALSRDIASPFELLNLFNDKRWHRTYFEKAGEGLTIYLLDANNLVLRKLEISADVLYRIEKSQTELVGQLESFPQFENRIYPADRFFAALASLPEGDRRSVVSDPEILFSMPGNIVSVGISDEAVSGFIELGFEIETGTQRKVFVLLGREWAVWRLRSNLEQKASGPPTAPGGRSSGSLP